jgi:hypothetical protein
LAQLPEVVEALSGLRLDALVKRLPGLAEEPTAKEEAATTP